MLSQIRSLEGLSSLLRTSEIELQKAIDHSDGYGYRSFYIRKRSGGLREIRAPAAPLAHLQHLAFQALSRSPLDVHSAAHGFSRGRGILSNAIQHCGRSIVLNVDLKDFFLSISADDVTHALQASPISLDGAVAQALASLACDQGALPQGSPLSPLLSNITCWKLDEELSALAMNQECYYTRYADDITFSTDGLSLPSAIATLVGSRSDSVSLSAELQACLARHGFTPNYGKVRAQSRHTMQEVTGLRVNHRPLVRSALIRRIRSALHSVEKFGIESCEREFKKRGGSGVGSFISWVRGMLSFVRQIHGAGENRLRRLESRAAKVAVMPNSAPVEATSELDFWMRQGSRGAVRGVSEGRFGCTVFRQDDRVVGSASIRSVVLDEAGSAREYRRLSPRRLRSRGVGPCQFEPCMVVWMGSEGVTGVNASIVDESPFRTTHDLSVSLAWGAPLPSEGALVLDMRGRLLGFIHLDGKKARLVAEYAQFSAEPEQQGHRTQQL